VSPGIAVASRKKKIHMRPAFLFVLLTLPIIPHASHAQNRSADSLFLSESLENAISTIANTQKALYSGTSYKEIHYDPKKGHPFFQSDTRLTGDILYHNILYRNEEFQYDMVRDEIILEHLTGSKIILVREKLSLFTTQGHTFRYFPGDKKLKSGYYDVLLDKGGTQLIAKRNKKVKGNPHAAAPYFVESAEYYLLAKDVYHKIRNTKDIARILADGSKTKITTSKKDAEARMIDVIMQFETVNK
jgi:hypothetical protein